LVILHIQQRIYTKINKKDSTLYAKNDLDS
jgi:hypothetical protein